MKDQLSTTLERINYLEQQINDVICMLVHPKKPSELEDMQQDVLTILCRAMNYEIAKIKAVNIKIESDGIWLAGVSQFAVR